MFGRDLINKLNMLLHSTRRYFHDDNGLPNLEALKNIYQVVAQQLLNSRERYVKKCHNQQRSESPVQAGDLILIKDNTAKSFEPLYKGNYRVVKVLLCCSNVVYVLSRLNPFQINLEFGTTHQVGLCVIHPRYAKSNQIYNKLQN